MIELVGEVHPQLRCASSPAPPQRRVGRRRHQFRKWSKLQADKLRVSDQQSFFAMPIQESLLVRASLIVTQAQIVHIGFSKTDRGEKGS